MASKGTGRSVNFIPKTFFQTDFLEINPILTTKNWKITRLTNIMVSDKNLNVRVITVEDNGTILLWRDPVTLNFCQLVDKPVQERLLPGWEAEGEETELRFVPMKAECSVSCSPGAKLNLDTCRSTSQVTIAAKIFNDIAQLQTRLN